MDRADREWIRAAIGKARQKLGASRVLLREGCYEDAVSRAYYVAFHCIQALLRTEGQHARTHKGAMTLFGLLFVKPGKFRRELGRWASTLQDDREAADYDAYSTIDGEIAESAIGEAKEILQETERYLESLGLDLANEQA